MVIKSFLELKAFFPASPTYTFSTSPDLTDCCLIYNPCRQALPSQGAFFFLSVVAPFWDCFGSSDDLIVVGLDDGAHVSHATVADLHTVFTEDFVKFAPWRKVLV